MTLEALALSVLLPSFSGTAASPDMLNLLDDGLGGVCLFGANTSDGPAPVAELTRRIRSVAPTSVIAIDEEGGDVTRLHASHGSPVLGALALGAADDVGMTRAVGRAIGLELAELGINLCLGPVADVNSQENNPVIGTRSFGGSPANVGSHVAAWTIGMQSAGVAACAKHFPGHGDTAADSHVALPIVGVDREVLMLRELVPFAASIEAGVAAIMTAHIAVPAIDPVSPATFSPSVIGLLRDPLDFQGVIVSDALDMAGASRGRGIPEAAVLALMAGVDLLCLGPRADVEEVRSVQTALVNAVRGGRLPEQRLVSAALKVDDLVVSSSPGPDLNAEALAGAATQSVTVDGLIPDLTRARSVRIDGNYSDAVESAPWGLPADLVVVPGDGALPDGPLIIQVRDASRQPEVMAILDSAGSDSVVIEWGWPISSVDRNLATINARGWSQPGAKAVSTLLADAASDR